MYLQAAASGSEILAGYFDAQLGSNADIRVGFDGTPLEAVGHTYTLSGLPSVIGSAGTSFVSLLYADWKVTGALIGADGVQIGPAFSSAPFSPAQLFYPANIASDGAHYFVLESTGFGVDVYALLLDASGNLTRAPRYVTPGGAAVASNPAIASNGSSFFVPWTDDRNGVISPAVLATTVALDGMVRRS